MNTAEFTKVAAERGHLLDWIIIDLGHRIEIRSNFFSAKDIGHIMAAILIENCTFYICADEKYKAIIVITPRKNPRDEKTSKESGSEESSEGSAQD